MVKVAFEKFVNWITGEPMAFFDAVNSTFGTGADTSVGLVPAPPNPAVGYVLRDNGTWGPGGRELLIANRTYYVRSDGSDSNNGLTNTPAGAFLTLQHAIDVLGTLDLSIYDATITIGIAGTYAGCTVSAPFIGGPGSSVTISGDVAAPSNYVISSVITVSNYAVLNLSGLDYTSNGNGITATIGGIINVTGTCVFGVCTSNHIVCTYGGSIVVSANYTIDGGTNNHMVIQYNSIIFNAGITVTLTGTPAFTSFFIVCSEASSMQGNGNTYVGAATGTRYLAQMNGVIQTLGGGANYFPGNAPGSTATGGQYA